VEEDPRLVIVHHFKAVDVLKMAELAKAANPAFGRIAVSEAHPRLSFSRPSPIITSQAA
jgi:hypothetical protein